MQQIYQIFSLDKLIILTGDPLRDQNMPHVEVNSRKTVKDAYVNFINSTGNQSLVLYNNSNVTRLLEDFVSLFWYVEASGGMVKNTRGETLFIYRFGRWDLPKGKIEKLETKTEAALREVQEETGLKELEIIRPLPSSFHIFDHKGKKVLKRTYWFEMLYTGTDEPTPQLEEDITRAVWIQPSDISSVLSNTYASIKTIITQ